MVERGPRVQKKMSRNGSSSRNGVVQTPRALTPTRSRESTPSPSPSPPQSRHHPSNLSQHDQDKLVRGKEPLSQDHNGDVPCTSGFFFLGCRRLDCQLRISFFFAVTGAQENRTFPPTIDPCESPIYCKPVRNPSHACSEHPRSTTACNVNNKPVYNDNTCVDLNRHRFNHLPLWFHLCRFASTLSRTVSISVVPNRRGNHGLNKNYVGVYIS